MPSLTKDLLTLGFSAFAIVISILAFTVTTRLKRFEMQRSTRDQLNKLISEMLSSAARDQEILKTAPGMRPSPQQLMFASISAQRHSALARQADYLAQQEPSLVTDVEWATIAQAFSSVGDFSRAEERFQRAISAAPDEYYRVLNIRGLADMLFHCGRLEEGRKYYQNALSVLPDTTDNNKITNLSSLDMWLINELSAGQAQEADRIYEKASNLCSTIGNAILRTRTLNHLETRFADAREWARSAKQSAQDGQI